MLGTLRFALAWVVMLSHMPFSPFAIHFNPAVSAVILFYYISGYLMYGSFAREVKKHTAWKEQVRGFFIKRFLRLFPLYWIVLTATVIGLVIWGKSKYVTLLQQDLDFMKLILNYLLLLNNYVFSPWQIPHLLPHPLIPPTWSLSTEWHFYLLVPFLFFLLRRWWVLFFTLLFGSLFFELYAFAHLGPTFNSDNFGYRYIFGVLWIFMFGFLRASGNFRTLWKFLYIIIIIYALFFMFRFALHPYVREVTLGLLLTPLIEPIMKLRWSYDWFFGMLSYPIFIVHFFVFYLVEHFIDPVQHRLGYFYTVFLGVLFLSFLLALIQGRIDTVRKKY